MDDLSAMKAMLLDYYKAFSTLDPSAAARYFPVTSAMVIPVRGVILLPNQETLVAALRDSINALRARGYVRSELAGLQVRQLSDTAAVAAGVAVRFKADGQELDRAGVTYTLQKGDSGWRIAVLVVHDPDRGLGLK